MEKPRVTQFEHPDMENPVYCIDFIHTQFFIQRQEGMNPSDTAWYLVKKDSEGYWINVSEYCLGWTKQEAIDYITKTYL